MESGGKPSSITVSRPCPPGSHTHRGMWRLRDIITSKTLLDHGLVILCALTLDGTCAQDVPCVDANRNEGKGTHVSVHAYLMRGDNDGELSWPFKGTIHQPAQPAGRWAAPHQGSCGCLNVALLKTPTPRGCVVEIEVHSIPPGNGQFISSNLSYKKSSTHLQWWWEGVIPGRWREYYIQ